MPTDWTVTTWHKSSYSEPNGGDCLEHRWQKSSFSSSIGQDCVEARLAEGTRVTGYAEVRDTKDRKGGSILITPSAWRAFLAQVA